MAGLLVAQPALATDCATLGGTETGGECVVTDSSGNPVVVHYTHSGSSNLTVNATNAAGVSAPSGEGIRATNTDGNLTVNVDGDVTSNNGSIVASTTGGDLNLHAKGALTATSQGDGVSLNASGSGFAVGATQDGNVNVQVDGKITAADDGVDAEMGDVQDVTITTADIEAGGPLADGDGGRGIFLTRSGTGNTTITTDNVNANGAGFYVSNNGTGDVTINAKSVTSGIDNAIQVGGTMGALDITTTGQITTGTRVAPTDIFTSGGGNGIQLTGAVGSTGAPQPTTITTKDIDVTGTGVNLAPSINRLDGATTVKTGNIIAGGMGVALDTNDNADQYLVDVETGNITSGSSGIGVNNSGTGGIKVVAGNIDAGTASAGGIVSTLGSSGGYGVMQQNDAHGTTDSSGASDVSITTGNITVTNRTSGAFAGTGVSMNGSGNGNTTLTTGNISAGEGVDYNRTGTGAIDLTTGDIDATTGDGVNFGNDITHNDVTVTTGDINAKGYGIYGNSYIDAGKMDVKTGNVTAGSNAINLIHSGQGPLNITVGDNITSTGGMGLSIQQDPAAGATGGFTLATKDVSARSRGINLTQNDNVTGDVSITNTGFITSTADRGVYVDQSAAGGNLDVTLNDVTAASNAVELYGDSTGNTTVTTNGAVSSTGGYGVYVAKRNTGDVTIHTKDTVTAANDAIALAALTNGNVNITTDKDITSTGANGIDLGGSANGGTNTGSVTITAGGDIKAGGFGINGDTGGATAASTIDVADINAGSTGINYIHSGDQDFNVTANNITSTGGTGLVLTNDAVGRPAGSTTTPSNTNVTVNDITANANGANISQTGPGNVNFTSTGLVTSTSGFGVYAVTGALAGDTTINVNDLTSGSTGIYANASGTGALTINTTGAISTPTASINHAGDGIDAYQNNAAAGPLAINVGKNSSITSYQNAMELTNNGTAGTTVNVDGALHSTFNAGGSDGVIWVWNTPGTITVNINDGSKVQAADPTGFAMTDNSGNSVVTVGDSTVTGGFRLGNGNDALTFNGTDMTNVGTLDGGDDATTADGMTDTLTLNGTAITRKLQTSGQEVDNWEAVNINGGTADLTGTLTTGKLTLGKDSSGNPATLSIGAGTVGDTLTVSGDYSSTGGMLALDADSSTHSSDKLIVGGSTSGSTALGLNDLTPTASTSDQQDIEVVDVTGTSPGGAFVLANGPAMLGGTNYTLGQQGNNWFLVAQKCPPAAGQALGCVTPDTLTYGGTTVVSGNVQGAGGSDLITVQDGASVTGIVAGGDPGADASASQDAGDTITINTTGSVGGVEGDLADDIIKVKGASTVTGDVDGNDGDDQIAIGDNSDLSQTASVQGNVLGDAGNDQLWVLGNSNVAGNVAGGDGVDAIVLNGAQATVGGAIDGGAGDDIIHMMAGTANSVAGGTGNDTITLAGATVTGAIDAGDGDNVVDLDSGSAGSVAAGAGNDQVSLAGATVSGAINAGDGNNTVHLNGGTAGDVTTGTGIDAITLAGATVGAINAGDGDNTVALNSGNASSVTAGTGVDNITLAGATISGAINAGDGDNIVALSSGRAGSVTAGAGMDKITLDGASISGVGAGAGAIDSGAGNDMIELASGNVIHVDAGDGDDFITLDGAIVNGPATISGGADNDTIVLTSGSFQHVAGGTGNDTITWDAQNATIIGAKLIEAGDGTDSLTVAGHDGGIHGATLDGGAGSNDTLNLNQVTDTFADPDTQLKNWDTVNVDASDLTVTGGSLTAAQVNLMNTTLIARNGFTVNGNLSLDPSTIDMQDGATGDIFTVAGNYNAVGTGNALKIDADFQNNKADELHVGGTVSGVTDLKVQNVTPDVSKSTGQDVVVAESATAGGISTSNFSLAGGPITSGIWDYDLASGTAPDTVVLHGTLNATGALYSAAIGSLADTFGRLPTLEQRVGQRQWLARGNGGFFDGAWLRMSGDHATTTPATSAVDFSTYNDSWGAQVGVDFVLLDDAEGRLTAGITGQYKGMNADVRTKTGEGGIRAHGGGGGINVTWNGVHGEYADVQAQYNKVYATLSTDRTGTTVDGLSADSKSASLEIGKRFVVSADGRNVLVPQAQISWGLFSTDPFTDSNNIAVDLGTEETAVARMGLAYEFHPDGIDLRDPNKGGKMFYAIFNVLQSLSPRTSSQAQGKMLDTLRERTWGQIGVGGSLAMSDNVLLYGEVGYRASFQELSNTRNNGVGGTIGIRVGF